MAAYSGPKNEDLSKLFIGFCSFGTSKKAEEMDGAKFAKFCRDCGLLDAKFKSTDVDLVFTKAKPKAARKVDYNQFVGALHSVAERKGTTLDALVDKVVAAGGPVSSGTQAEAVKFHDDKSLYTGVHNKGGPTTVDNKITLSNLADRSASDVRGRKVSHEEDRKGSFEKADKSTTKVVPATSGHAIRRASSDKKASAPATEGADGLKGVFDSFVAFGGGTGGKDGKMEGAKFAKLCRECGLIDKKLTSTSVDLTFNKVKAKGERKIGYEEFVAALAEIAKVKGCSVEDVTAHILKAGGPGSSGTIADAVKFHDDKSLYTGVHANGGPTTVDDKISLSNLADRSAADIRGLKLT